MTRRRNSPYHPHHPDLSGALGDIPNVIYSDKFGHNPSVGTGVEDVWSAGGTYAGWITTASTVRVRSGGNANDTAAGTGAQKIMVVGLDENWNAAQEEITLAGASASAATTTTFIRVNRLYVTDCGTYGGTNTGVIIVEDTGTSAILAEILAGLSSTEMFMLSVPADHTAHLHDIHIYVESAKTVELRLWARINSVDPTQAPYGAARLIRRFTGIVGDIDLKGDGKPSFDARTDIWMDARTISGSSSAVSVIGTGWFVAN